MTDTNDTPEEHPAFTRARELKGHLENHFPTNPEQAACWEHFVTYRALHSRVLCVAHTRVETAWCAYCAPVTGYNHDDETGDVLRHGDKLDEGLARFLFPIFDGVPYAD